MEKNDEDGMVTKLRDFSGCYPFVLKTVLNEILVTHTTPTLGRMSEIERDLRQWPHEIVVLCMISMIKRMDASVLFISELLTHMQKDSGLVDP